MTGRRTAAQRVGSALLTIAAIGGVLCILSVLMATFFGISLIMFKTGSMSPTIPTGSLAIVREIPADHVSVGDVVTVDRPDALPVTHRVIAADAAGGGVMSLTLRGDANPVQDPSPYLVSHVRLVLFSVPGLAYVVGSFSNPLALGGVTLGAAAIVTWAFWPREEARRVARRARRVSAHGSAGAHHAGMIMAVLLAVGVSAAAAPAKPASAAETEQTITGTAITLVSVGDAVAMADLQPGAPVLWQVGVSAHPADPGTVDLSMSGSGGLMGDARGLWVTVSSCAQRWVGSSCPGGSVIAGPAAASSLLAQPLALGTMPSTATRWFLVSAVVPSSPTILSGTANLSFIASGTGTPVVAGSSAGSIAFTGSDLRPAVNSALAALVLGLGLASIARLRRTRAVRL